MAYWNHMDSMALCGVLMKHRTDSRVASAEFDVRGTHGRLIACACSMASVTG